MLKKRLCPGYSFFSLSLPLSLLFFFFFPIKALIEPIQGFSDLGDVGTLIWTKICNRGEVFAVQCVCLEKPAGLVQCYCGEMGKVSEWEICDRRRKRPERM